MFEHVNSELLMLFLVFVLFLIVAKKAYHVLYNTLIIVFLSALFPYFANGILGMNLPLDLNTSLQFAVLGAILYFSYLYVKLLWVSSRALSRVLAAILSPVILLIKSAFKRKKKKGEGSEERD